MRTHSVFRAQLRLMSCISLLGVFLLAACTPEANPAPTNPPSEPTNPPTAEEPTTPEEEPVEEKQLIVENGDRTDVLSAQAASASFDKTYLVPEGVDVVSTSDSLTFSALPDLDYDFQVTVSSQTLPADYDLTLRRDFTSLSLRSEENEPHDIDLDLFPELHFDYYLSINNGSGVIHRLVQFDQDNEEMYVATLTLPDVSPSDHETYEEVVSLFHAILISANEEDEEEKEPVAPEYATLTLSEKLLDRSVHEENRVDEDDQVSQLTTIFEESDIKFPVEKHVLFDSIEVELPEGYEMRTLGEQSYSFTNPDDPEYEPVSLIIGLAHPDIPLNLHINALRSSGEELSADEFPALYWYDYAFAEENEDGTYEGLTLIKELDDGRTLDASVRTGEEQIDTVTLVKLITALATIETKEASSD